MEVEYCGCGHRRALHEDGSNECSYELWDDGQWLEECCDCRHFSLRRSNGQPAVPPTVNHGQITIEVWPTYCGLAESADGVTLVEQVGHPDYLRGQIWWDTDPGGDILGHARVCLPKGVYTHLLFCHGPVERIIGWEQFEHPLVFDRAGFFDVSPIVNRSYIPRR